MLQVTWMNRRGAGCMRGFPDSSQCVEFIKRLKAKATVRDDTGRIVGGVDDNHESVRCDDRRVRWLWWCETDDKEPTARYGNEVADARL